MGLGRRVDIRGLRGSWRLTGFGSHRPESSTPSARPRPLLDSQLPWCSGVRGSSAGYTPVSWRKINLRDRTPSTVIETDFSLGPLLFPRAPQGRRPHPQPPGTRSSPPGRERQGPSTRPPVRTDTVLGVPFHPS